MAGPSPLNLAVFSYNDLLTISDETRRSCQAADLVVCLGGVNLSHLAAVIDSSKPALAVLGPRDDSNVPAPFRVLHANGFTFRGWRIAGFSGAPQRRIAPGFYVSEPEAERLLGALPPCDLLITHAPGSALRESEIRPELGFEAIDRYLRDTPPIYHLYAHPSQSIAEEVGETLSIGVYGYLCPPALQFV